MISVELAFLTMGIAQSKKRNPSFDGEPVSFDHFQVLRAIGKGSFGKVCIVQKHDTKRLYAMKYMNKAQCEAKDAVTNVFREMQILASVSHPFLVNFWFSFQDTEDMFMVVDLLEGGDLRYHISNGVAFSDDTVLLYVLEAACALDYLHSHHILHRDIKPDNMLLDAEGHVHLTDFNVAIELHDGDLATSLSGTKPYMAPEVFACAVDAVPGYSFPVDWWSLGVAAYEVRKGRRPYDIHAGTPLAEVRRLQGAAPRYPRDWGAQLVTLLDQLLTPAPSARLCSLARALRACGGGSGSNRYTAESLLAKLHQPGFVPPKDHLNCDPTFELEEMIIESRPLHKKKKRLSKQRSLLQAQSSLSVANAGDSTLYDKMLIYNREQELAQQERERREREWQLELDASMNSSDPTGHGASYAGCSCKFDLKNISSNSCPKCYPRKESLCEIHKSKSIDSSALADTSCNTQPISALNSNIQPPFDARRGVDLVSSNADMTSVPSSCTVPTNSNASINGDQPNPDIRDPVSDFNSKTITRHSATVSTPIPKASNSCSDIKAAYHRPMKVRSDTVANSTWSSEDFGEPTLEPRVDFEEHGSGIETHDDDSQRFSDRLAHKSALVKKPDTPDSPTKIFSALGAEAMMENNNKNSAGASNICLSDVAEKMSSTCDELKHPANISANGSVKTSSYTPTSRLIEDSTAPSSTNNSAAVRSCERSDSSISASSQTGNPAAVVPCPAAIISSQTDPAIPSPGQTDDPAGPGSSVGSRRAPGSDSPGVITPCKTINRAISNTNAEENKNLRHLHAEESRTFSSVTSSLGDDFRSVQNSTLSSCSSTSTRYHSASDSTGSPGHRTLCQHVLQSQRSTHSDDGDEVFDACPVSPHSTMPRLSAIPTESPINISNATRQVSVAAGQESPSAFHEGAKGPLHNQAPRYACPRCAASEDGLQAYETIDDGSLKHTESHLVIQARDPPLLRDGVASSDECAMKSTKNLSRQADLQTNSTDVNSTDRTRGSRKSVPLNPTKTEEAKAFESDARNVKSHASSQESDTASSNEKITQCNKHVCSSASRTGNAKQFHEFDRFASKEADVSTSERCSASSSVRSKSLTPSSNTAEFADRDLKEKFSPRSVILRKNRPLFRGIHFDRQFVTARSVDSCLLEILEEKESSVEEAPTDGKDVVTGRKEAFNSARMLQQKSYSWVCGERADSANTANMSAGRGMKSYYQNCVVKPKKTREIAISSKAVDPSTGPKFEDGESNNFEVLGLHAESGAEANSLASSRAGIKLERFSKDSFDEMDQSGVSSSPGAHQKMLDKFSGSLTSVKFTRSVSKPEVRDSLGNEGLTKAEFKSDSSSEKEARRDGQKEKAPLPRSASLSCKIGKM